MRKWRLLLTTLPVVVAMLVLKLVIERLSGHGGWVDFSDVSAVLTAGAFLIGFMLAGTMADFKESEKLPSELVTTLETIEDLIVVSACKPGFDAAPARRDLAAVAERVLQWLDKQAPLESVHLAIEAMNGHFQSMDLAGATAHANRSIVFMNAVRRIVGRMDVIRRTGFLQTGYAILEVIVVSILLLLLASRFKTLVAEYTLVVSISMIYVYMLRLIRDIDDPFDYGVDSEGKGAAEVELFPLTEYIARARSRSPAAVEAAPALLPGAAAPA
jgi:hypothetical protein